MDVAEINLGQDLKEAFETGKKPYSFHFNELLDNQQFYESNARTYPRRLPLAIARAEGIYIEDTEGRVFLDCLCGAGALALGHNHPTILDAMKTALDSKMPLLTLDITTPAKDKFVRDIMAVLPVELADNCKIQFCSPSGADAIEAAIKLVKSATGRRGIMAFQGSYHGMTHGALSVTSATKPKSPIANLMADVVFLPYPYDYRCPFGIGGEAGETAILEYIENVLKDSYSGIPPIAGILLETVQGEGGGIPASDNWMRGLRRITREQGIPLIIDEVQTGIGRTGAMFSFQHSGIVPDVVVISKAIGGGLPLSLIIYDRALDKWASGAHVGTFRGNQLAMVAGSALLKVIEEEKLVENSRRIGEYMLNRLSQLKSRFPIIGDIRGKGCMLAAEMVDIAAPPDKRGKYPLNSGLSHNLQQECFKWGLIIELGGREDSTIRFMPPINIDRPVAAAILDIFEMALITLTKEIPHGIAE